MSSTHREKITVAEFLEKAQVEGQIKALQEFLETKAVAEGRPAGYMPKFSDMIAVENGREYQYVDYVQEGGGVLGVALVGYAYVLERLGIRFLKLAGTSAGAINTLMMAAVDPANYPTDLKGKPVTYNLQTEAILHEMLDYDLWNLVDSETPWWKSIIKNFISQKDYTKRIKSAAITSLAVLLGITLLALLFTAFSWGPAWLGKTALVFGIAGVLTWVSAFAIGRGLKNKAAQFVKAGFGINRGDAFHTWMTDILRRNKVPTTAALEKKMRERMNGVHLRPERFNLNGMGYNSEVTGSMLKIIACDITNENKVEFPDFAWFYYDNPNEANPADFVRASMSIPVFFRPFTLATLTPESRLARMQAQGKPTGDRDLEKLNAVLKNIREDGQESRFVDGGILSNFPINVFHNSRIAIARMPTLGAKLEDEEHQTPEKKMVKRNSLGSYLGSIFTTLRFYYDRDFLKKNSVYQLGVAHIDVEKINWLNFSMDTDEQLKLFKRGVDAATTFFTSGGTFYRDGEPVVWQGYDWENYKRARKEKMID